MYPVDLFRQKLGSSEFDRATSANRLHKLRRLSVFGHIAQLEDNVPANGALRLMVDLASWCSIQPTV